MKQIRKSIFETNSSSSHSLVFSKYDRGFNYELPVNEDGVLKIRFGEYGWGPDMLVTPYEKLCYWFTDNVPENISCFYDKNMDNDKWFKENIDELRNGKFKNAINVIKEKCPQVKDIEFIKDEDFYLFGYIDHESVGVSRETDFENLVFNNGVIVIIDNDNNYYFEEYMAQEKYVDDEWTKLDPEKDPDLLFEVNDIESFISELYDEQERRYAIREKEYEELIKKIREKIHKNDTD